MSKRVLITGFGALVPAAVADGTAAPEITGFEVPEGAPTFGYELLDFKVEEHFPNIKTYLDRVSALALTGAKLALENAGLRDQTTRPAGLEIGCAYGTTFGGLDSMGLFWKKAKTANPKFAPPLVFTHGYANSPSSLVCIEFGLRGPAATFSGSNLSGVEALQFAFDQIAAANDAGEAACMLVGASEALSAALHAHLNAEKLLSASGKAQVGIIPGEGAVFLVLESEASVAARGRVPLAVLHGVGMAANADWNTARAQAHADSSTPTNVIHTGTGTKGSSNAGQHVHGAEFFSVAPLLGITQACSGKPASIHAEDPAGNVGVLVIREK